MSRGPIGRGAEFSTLRAIVASAAAGRGQVAVVLGEAGIGKTTLLDALAGTLESAGSDATVLRGRATPGSGPYRAPAEAVRSLARPDAAAGPYVPALARLRPDWAPGWAPDWAPGRAPAAGVDFGLDASVVLGEGLLRVLPARAVVLLDDLHWADPDTIALIDYLAGVIADRPLAIVGAARDDEPAGPSLRRLIGRGDVVRVRLGRLPDADVLAIAARHTGAPVPDEVRARLLAAADGLPLLVRELAGATGPLPAAMTALVAERLAAVSTGDRRVVAAAALAGAENDPGLLAGITGAGIAEVAAALGRAHPHLLVDDGGRSRWRHALTRDAVVAQLRPAERAALAGRAADRLLARGDDEAAAGLLELSGDRPLLVTTLLRMARRDAAAGALRTATAHLDRTAALLPPSDARAAEIAAARVRVRTAAGDAAGALADGRPALAHATGDGHAGLCLALAEAAVAAGLWSEVDALLERAGRPADPDALTLAAEAAYGAGDLARATGLAARAVAAAPAGDGERQGRALVARGRCALLTGPPHAARTDFRRAAQLAAEHRRPALRVTALVATATAELYDAPWSAAVDEARAVALGTGQLAQVAGLDLFRAEAALTVDGPVAAAAVAAEVAALAGSLRLTPLVALAEVLQATAPAVAGRPAAMTALLTAAASRPAAAGEVAPLAATVRALNLVAARDHEAAIAELDAAAEALRRHGTAAPVPVWGLWALLRTVAGDRGAEARTAARAVPAARRATNSGGLDYADAVAARDPAGLDRGNRAFAGHPWWGRLLRLLALEAAVRDGWGSPVPQLRADLDHFVAGGYDTLARTGRDLLRTAGAPVRRGRGGTAVPDSLRALGVTSREMDVLSLVADGLTNAGIADRLFLSRRTVDTHVAALLAKTGAAGRAGLRTLGRPEPPP